MKSRVGLTTPRFIVILAITTVAAAPAIAKKINWERGALAWETAHPGASSTLRQQEPVAVCTPEELDDLLAIAKQQDKSDTDALGTAYLAYEEAALRQYLKFTFGTAVFIQSKGRKNGEGLDEIDHWIITAGLDGHLVSASHDQIVEDNARVVAWKELPNGDKEAVSVAQGIIDRFLAVRSGPL
jgi:hypothetical protein